MLQHRNLLEIVFSVLFALWINLVIYFSFANIYSAPLINYKDFITQYTSGIYQYRFLSVWIIDHLYHFFSTIHIPLNRKYLLMDQDAELPMFLAYFTINTFFLCLSAATLSFLFCGKEFSLSRKENILLTMVTVFAMAISQYVLVPYDASALFFSLLFFLVFLKFPPEKSMKNVLLLSAIITLSAINRETAALSISLAATLLFLRLGVRRVTLVPIVIFALSFVAVYFGMRFYFGSFSTNDGNLFSLNFSEPKNFLGMFFWGLFFALSIIISKSSIQKKYIVVFHIFSFPYIFMCFYTGILYEIRLYVPLLTVSLILSQLNLKKTESLQKLVSLQKFKL